MAYFVLDLDGTVLTDSLDIDDKTIDVLDTVRDLGHTVMVATGRAFEITAPYLDILEPYHAVILNNGGIIRNIETHTNILENSMDKATVITVNEYLTQHDISFSISTAHGLYTSKNYELGYYERFMKMFPKYPLVHRPLVNIEEIPMNHVHKILVHIPVESQIRFHQKALQQRIKATVTQSMKHFLSILPNNVTKGATLKKYCEENAIPLDQLIIFGDNDNDVEMLNLSPHSYAMKNASDNALKAAAHRTLYDNNHGGVARTIEKLLNLN